MSAFVVKDKTINKIVGYLRHSTGVSETEWICSRHRLHVDTEHNCKALGQALFAMNCEAVNQRYGENQAQEFRPLDYQYKFELPNQRQAYQALRCLLYQCREGDVPETELYKGMDAVSDSIAHDFARRACEDLPWE